MEMFLKILKRTFNVSMNEYDLKKLMFILESFYGKVLA